MFCFCFVLFFLKANVFLSNQDIRMAVNRFSTSSCAQTVFAGLFMSMR